MPIPEKQLALVPKRIRSDYLEHFLAYTGSAGVPNGVLGLSVTSSGGSFSLTGNDALHPGVIQLGTGTTTTGRIGIASNVTMCMYGSCAYEYETAFKLGALSNTIDSYSLWLGLSDTNSNVQPGSGAGLYYVQGTSTFGYCSRRSNAQTLNASITADTNWHVFNMKINKAASSIIYTLDGANPQTLTTNIPQTASARNGVISIITKSAGTTAVNLLIDYMYLKMDFS